MPQYRKKPVEVDAVQLPFPDKEMPQWLAKDASVIFKRHAGMIVEAIIATLEGVMSATLRDWIIRGVKGEIYPCKPDIFAATYEPAEEPLDLGQFPRMPGEVRGESAAERAARIQNEQDRWPRGGLTGG